jgi:hypothetical protein
MGTKLDDNLDELEVKLPYSEITNQLIGIPNRHDSGFQTNEPIKKNRGFEVNFHRQACFCSTSTVLP